MAFALVLGLVIGTFGGGGCWDDVGSDALTGVVVDDPGTVIGVDVDTEGGIEING